MLKRTPYITETFHGCTLEPMFDTNRKYFGIGLKGTDSNGCTKHYVRVTFPDKTWIDCCNPLEAKTYINKYLGRWPRKAA